MKKIFISFLTFTISFGFFFIAYTNNHDKKDLFILAEEAFIEGQYKNSIEFLNQLIAKEGRKRKIIYLLSLNYFELGDFQEARKLFLELVEQDPLITFTNKEEFYKKLDLIDNWFRNQEILKEVQLKSQLHQVMIIVLNVVFIVILLAFILFFFQDRIKSFFLKKEKKDNENLDYHFELSFDEIDRDLAYIEKMKQSSEISLDLKIEIDKNLELFYQQKKTLFREYEYLQLNYENIEIVKKNQFMKRLELIKKEIQNLKRKCIQ